ncbi:MAG: 3-phosphoshikimate 1-carboxyvinyltransferase [Candidatus Limnocylindrales bacterium]
MARYADPRSSLPGERPITSPRFTLPSGTRHISPARSLRGEPRLPGDKSISHRALLLAALAEGESSIRGAGDSGDVRATAALVAALGVAIERSAPAGEPAEAADGHAAGSFRVDYRVVSPGVDGLAEPDAILDCRNSGTTLRLGAGVLAGLPVFAVLDGDDSLRRRPVARIIEPLRSMGAVLHARRRDSLPPLAVLGRPALRAIDVATPVPSAQVKSAILLAGLRAEGRTTVREAVATRDHTERMLRARGVAVAREAADEPGGGGVAWSLEGGGRVRAVDEQVPGDPSAAAFWLVAGAIHPDAELTLHEVGVNPTRRAVIDILLAMGARIEERNARPDDGVGEPVADLIVRSSELRAVGLGPADVAAAIDEIPILCLAATQANGTTVIRGAGELRHKESDRIAGVAAGLAVLGARIDVDGDDIEISGPTALRGAATATHDDHRLAMTFAIAGLVATGGATIEDAESASVSYPGFFAELERVRA